MEVRRLVLSHRNLKKRDASVFVCGGGSLWEDKMFMFHEEESVLKSC